MKIIYIEYLINLQQKCPSAQTNSVACVKHHALPLVTGLKIACCSRDHHETFPLLFQMPPKRSFHRSLNGEILDFKANRLRMKLFNTTVRA